MRACSLTSQGTVIHFCRARTSSKWFLNIWLKIPFLTFVPQAADFQEGLEPRHCNSVVRSLQRKFQEQTEGSNVKYPNLTTLKMDEQKTQPPVSVYFMCQLCVDKASQRRDPCKWWRLWMLCKLVLTNKGETCATYFPTKDSMTESSWQRSRMPFRAVSSFPNCEGSTCSRRHTRTEARWRRPRKHPLSPKEGGP